MEKRRSRVGKSTPLPLDFSKLVTEVMTNNFEMPLKELQKLKGTDALFKVSGEIHPDEVTLAISLGFSGELAATTVYASVDFDPRASSPTVQDVLGAGVDAIGSLFQQLLSSNRLPQISADSLSALENIPFDWTPTDVERHKVWLKVDKANPELDAMADDWLERNDPQRQERLAEEQAETEKRFVTGPKSRDPHGGSH